MSTAYAFGTRLTDSFAKFRWCPNIIGPQSGGAVDDLPLHHFESMGEIETKIPTEVLVSDRREYELAEEGFIALTMRKGTAASSSAWVVIRKNVLAGVTKTPPWRLSLPIWPRC